ncbi:hypothetical protein [Aporhodopirellula aestuarii]|uniref:Uncharacterized protein n=1 Tax=Aporhodopirellula aestuarii TaxID=2950107 RepID=A0ABT0TXI8_9BACT|nr:hypothetical protein [Aporhodopirellula aestuarii]MCM2369250.1 hypothetical protein [Aporhodopirellula aestuarii]
MSAETNTQTTDSSMWMRTREVITERWPHLDREELAQCPNSTSELIEFVKHRVEASEEEVRSVVEEFAPRDSILDRVTHAAESGLRRAGGTAEVAYRRADEVLAKRPTESVLTGFLVGVVLGATVTALFMQSKPEPTVWDRMKDRSWS